jgi:CubicO group peptidase (beta-lactamase class C family)
MKMKKDIILSYILIIFLLSSCENLILGPDDNKPPEAEKYSSRFATILDSLRYSLDLPALAGAIVTDTGLTEAGVVGCRRYGGPKNVTINDCFHLGSCGKSFTSVLIGTLIDEGLLRWNSTLSDIFPEYVNTMRSEYKDATVLNILSHSAGFMRDPELTLHSVAPEEKRKEVVAWALNQAPEQQRGKFLYSNLGYIIAGAIAEKITNRTYEDLLMERVIQPLGLSTAGFGTMGTVGKEDQPLQHTANHAPVIAEPDAGLDPCYDPAGGLYMSVSDWGKYCQWVLTIEAGHHQDLLNDNTARMLTTPYVAEGGGLYYALGWGVIDQDWAGGKTLQHSGSNSLNYSTVWLASVRHFGIILMTNQGAIGDEWPLGPAFWCLLDYYQKGD